MFEKEAEEYADTKVKDRKGYNARWELVRNAYLAGAKLGYNKANEWHYVKDGDLPPEDTKVLALMAEKEICIAHFYRKTRRSKSIE